MGFEYVLRLITKPANINGAMIPVLCRIGLILLKKSVSSWGWA
jgi:hypothetical protein